MSTRVSNTLGEGRPSAARLAAYVTAALTVIVSISGCLIASLFKRQLALAFSRDPDVVALVVATMPILALALIGDGVNAACSGVVRGVGRQALGACLNVFSFWVCGIPLSVLLAFHFKMGVAGLWIGLLFGTSLQGASHSQRAIGCVPCCGCFCPTSHATGVVDAAKRCLLWCAGAVLSVVICFFNWQREGDNAAARMKAAHQVHRSESGLGL